MPRPRVSSADASVDAHAKANLAALRIAPLSAEEMADLEADAGGDGHGAPRFSMSRATFVDA